ncbi:hypothetical protein PL11_002100 [Lentilactobacillus curieae]|uniref:Extracellular protein n=1 Tax=Lentilactobacillus curieae TaxID=1138822 RepID=A0A1S6QGR3_9LACO|nr:hypothetical protein [Lentilactobacillus curieae]AQW20789.1 hypothetical protein PL11_002100 [Lentilactobacillus curieae]
MKIQLKKTALVAILFTSLGLAGASAVHADVIDAPGDAGSIKTVNAGNVLKDYSEESLNTVNNDTPQGNKDRKYTKYKLDPTGINESNTYQTISGSSQSNMFSTKWFLPDGFNVSNYQHGNFQSVALDNDNHIYFVESNGTNTNYGAIVKFDLAKLEKLGVNTDINALWRAFDYFNPYTEDGLRHNQEYDAAYSKMQDDFDAIKSLTTTLNKNKSYQNNQENWMSNAQKWYYKWKDKRNKYQKKTTAKYSYKTRQNAKKIVKQSKAKMAKWMKSYQGHKAKIKAYDKKLATIQSQIDDHQNKVDSVKNENPDMFKYVDIAQTAQLSPQVDIGHGQTLTFNPQNQHLYLAEDNTLSDLKTDQDNVVMEMDPNTLKPIRQYKFKMLHNKGSKTSNLQLHTLAFDNDGNAYWGRKFGDGYMFFYGRLDEDSVKFSAGSSYVGNRGGDANQFVSVNPANGRLYFVSDDILTSVPASKVRSGDFSADDIHYQAFNSKREFEGLAFDQEGYGYLLALWPPELMVSSKPLN